MIIVDTSAWLCLFDKNAIGTESKLAKQYYESNKDTLLVTDLIIEETHKWLVHHAFPPKNAWVILDAFISQKFAQIVPIEENDRREANKLVEKYLDQQLSFTDSITVAIMRRLRLKKVFSFDRHFDLFKGVERLP